MTMSSFFKKFIREEDAKPILPKLRQTTAVGENRERLKSGQAPAKTSHLVLSMARKSVWGLWLPLTTKLAVWQARPPPFSRRQV